MKTFHKMIKLENQMYKNYTYQQAFQNVKVRIFSKFNTVKTN